MNRAEVLNVIIESLALVSGKDRAAISEQSHMIRDLGLESIDVVDLSYEVEKKLPFGVNVLEAFQMAELRSESQYIDPTVKELVDYIAGKLITK